MGQAVRQTSAIQTSEGQTSSGQTLAESIIILSSSYSNGKLTYSHITNYKDGTEGRGTKFVEIEEEECKRIEKIMEKLE